MGPVTEPARLEATRLASWPDYACLLRGLGARRGLLALDSAGGAPQDWSWIAFEPRPDLPLPSAPAGLRELLADLPRNAGARVPGPFQGGFMGALAYDSGVHGERQDLPRDPWRWPALVGGIYSDFFVFDHAQRAAWLVTSSEREPRERDSLVQLAAQCGPGRTHGASFQSVGELRRLTSRAEHCARIERARAEIAAGEYYQANLAHVFEARTRGNPLDLYLELRRVNPAPYMAYLRFEQGALLSAAPELLLEAQGRQLLTRPIKGTEARSSDPALDAQLGQRLLASSKDRAELAMIVDILRNDLGRVARLGSVRVAEFPQLRSYAGLHHLLADVTAELARGRDALDALLSVFPGGSVTGAPKLRAMDAIAQLEGEGRGYFTGSAGFLDVHGNACFNICIRTVHWRPVADQRPATGEVRFHVGGGITWNSQPLAEDRETLIKGARIALALGHDLQSQVDEVELEARP